LSLTVRTNYGEPDENRSDILTKLESLVKHLETTEARNDRTLKDISCDIKTLKTAVSDLTVFASLGQGEIERLSEDRESFSRNIAQLYTLFRFSNLSLNTTGYRLVLDGLAFSAMASRASNIEDSGRVKGTFEWVLHDNKIPESHAETLKISFRNWLSRGDGIFHIAGKPASGKSTLMSFVTGDPDTKNEFGKWGADNTSVAVVAAAFLWNVGSTDQKSMNGVYRTLLHSILDQHREDLIPMLFPAQLTMVKDLLLQDPRSAQVPLISNEHVEKAFLTLMMDKKSKFRFCLFIDGADEFNDPVLQKWHLVTKLKEWTHDNPERVKICVSSREEEPWLRTFPIEQRIRLHLTTKSDIQKMIEGAISEHQNFKTFDEAATSDFINHFVEKAKGVFLWVKLILADVVETLEYQNGLHDLYQVMDEYPKEMDDLFERIIEKVKSQEAWDILRIMVSVTEQSPKPQMLSLIHYSFVKYVRPGLPCEKDAVLQDDELPACQVGTLKRIEAFERNIPLLFRGFVDTTVRSLYPLGYNEKPSNQGISEDHKRLRHYELTSLDFAHRSVYQYISTRIKKVVGNGLDERLMVIQCLIAQARAFWGVERSGMLHISLLDVIPWIIKADADLYEVCFPWLEVLDNILRENQNLDVVDSRFAPLPPKSFERFKWRRGEWPVPIVSVFVLCALFEFNEYIAWAMGRAPWCLSTGVMQVKFLTALFRHFGLRSPNTRAILTMLLQERPEKTSLNCNEEFDFAPWRCTRLSIRQFVLARAIENVEVFDREVASWETLAVFLEYGADAKVRIEWIIEVVAASVGEIGVEFDPGVVIDPSQRVLILNITKLGHNNLDPKNKRQLEGDFSSPIWNNNMAVDIATKLPRGGSLKEIFTHFGPDDRPDILELLDVQGPDDVRQLPVVEDGNNATSVHDADDDEGAQGADVQEAADKASRMLAPGLSFNSLLLVGQFVLLLFLFGFWGTGYLYAWYAGITGRG